MRRHREHEQRRAGALELGVDGLIEGAGPPARSLSIPARSCVKDRRMMNVVTMTAGKMHAMTRQFSQKRIVRRGVKCV